MSVATDRPDHVVLEFELSQPLRAVEEALAAWLWAWLWPARTGDMMTPTPSLVNGLRDEPVFLVVDRAKYTEGPESGRDRGERRTLEGHALVTFDEPARPAYDEINASHETVLLVTVDGLPPATLTLEDREDGSLIRLLVHPCALSSRSDEMLFSCDLAVLQLTLPVVRSRLSRPSLTALLRDTMADIAGTAARRYSCGPALFQVADGAWVSPRLRQWTRSVPSAVTRIAEILSSQPLTGPLDDPSRMVEKLLAPARAISDGLRPDGTVAVGAPIRRGYASDIRSEPAPRDADTRLDGPVDEVRRLLILLAGGKELVTEEGRHADLLARLRYGPPGAWDAAILQAAPFGGRRWGLSPPTMPVAALALRGRRRQRALPRFLEHGPWKVEPLGDGVLVRASAGTGPDGAVFSQREVAMGWIRGLLPPLRPELREVASYDPDTRSVIVDTRNARPRLNAFADVAAWARDRVQDPLQPVDRVIAPFADPYLARLWLPYLWLCEIQVWTILDDTWTRIDRDYKPRWGRPGWFDWEV